MKANPERGSADTLGPVPLRVLIVEDSEDDTLLLLRELRRGGYETAHERVDTPEAMQEALAERGPWDLVISDWLMPRFSATEALEMLRATGSEAPFIIASGVVGEETAVEAMRAGAHDYVMKDNLTRLCATVERGLEEAKAHKERERAQRSLKESEERFPSLVMNSSDMITVFTPDGTRLYASPSIERVLGYKPEEIIGGNAFDLVHPDDAPGLREEFAERARTPGTGKPFKFRSRHADGTWRTFESIGTNFLDDPSVDGIVFNARDITDRKRTEEERDRLFEFSLDLLCVAGLDGYFRRVNPAFEETLGYSRSELLAKPFIEFVHPEDRAATISEMESLTRGVRTAYFENRYLRKDGSQVWLEWKAVPIVEEDLIYATARDVTERKRAEEALRRRDAILRAVALAAERFLKTASSWEERIEEVLERLGGAAEASRVYVFENYIGEDGELWTSQSYEWAAPGIAAQIDNPSLRAFPYRVGGFGRWVETLGWGSLIYGHTRVFPDTERQELRTQDIKSIMAVPIFVEGEWWGFIGFDECVAEREWSTTEIDALKAAADTLGAAIQRDRAESTLRESEERYRAVIEHATEGIFLCDAATGDILESNTAFRELLGYTTEELRSIKIGNLIADDRQSIDSNTRLILEEGGCFLGERRYRRKDGSLVDFEAAASLISYGGRQVICDVIRDITERKKAEEALRQSEQLYRTVIEQATEYISLVDVESKRIVGSNSAFREALGYTEEELKNMTLYDIVAHDRESIDTNVRQALERGRYLVGERKHRRKDGSLVDVEVSASTILHEGREVFCVVGHDVTERVEAHRMLERRVAALAGIAASLTVDRPMETTLHALAAGIVESTAAVACSVVLIDPQTSMIRLAGSHGLPEGYTGAMQASWQAGIHGRMVRVFRSQRPSLVHDARRVLLDNPLYAPIHPLVREVRWDVVYIVPLVVRGEALGATRRYPMHRAAMPQPRGLRGGGSRWPPSICTPPIPESFSHKHRYSSPS